MQSYDVIIMGAGVIGTAVARELSKYQLKVAVLEKEEDVCSGTSKANSGICHAGYDADTGSMKARMNLRGNALIHELSETLDFPFIENGSMVLCFDEAEKPALEALYNRGIANGVEGLSILSGEEARALEPRLSSEVVAALHAKTAGIVCPFLMTVAFAENAAVNGTEFHFLTEVKDVKDGYRILTDRGEYHATCVVNATGVYGDTWHNKICDEKIRITPRRGEYALMDHSAEGIVTHTIFQLPSKLGKGVLVTPTTHGNLMVGPNAYDGEDKEYTRTTAEGLREIKERALQSVPELPYRSVITSFAGLRAHEAGGDFILGEKAPGWFDAAGIASPGLTSAPAIGEVLAEEIAGKLQAVKKESVTLKEAEDMGFDPSHMPKETYLSERKGIDAFRDLPPEEQNRRIKERPSYGKIVCRCEGVTEGEIEDAIRRPVGAKSLDGIKRRVRQGMGRCQAGFCTPRAMEILARELGITMEEVCKNRPGSEILRGEIADPKMEQG